MVLTYSPHRDGGVTLHFPPPSHLHHLDTAAAIVELRRSLSRSPSKNPTFRLVASRPAAAVSGSPLSPSPLTFGAPVVCPPSGKKARSAARRSSPLESPGRRILTESANGGNAKPSALDLRAGVENESSRSSSPEEEAVSVIAAAAADAPKDRPSRASVELLAPHHAYARAERQNGYFTRFASKSSPLKRNDGLMNLDFPDLGSPSAKRRSVYGAFNPVDFAPLSHATRPCDGDASAETEAAAAAGDEASSSSPESPGRTPFDPASVFSPMPKRATSLRKTTLQQRHEKPAFARSRANGSSLTFDFEVPGSPVMRPPPHRMPSDDDAPPQPGRESLFLGHGGLPSASVHPFAGHRRNEVASQRHPLSRTITQSSSESSSLAGDSPTHVPTRPSEHRRPGTDFTRSLPVGTARPGLPRLGPPAGNSFATPESYRFAKPLPAAFMSTGLVSKRNRPVGDEPLDGEAAVGAMPDTPCKRPSALAAMMVPVPTPVAPPADRPRHGRPAVVHSFGAPSTPFNPSTSRPAVGTMCKGESVFGSNFVGSGLNRRDSFLGADGDEGSRSAPSGAELDVPPTPKKQVLDDDQIHLSTTPNAPRSPRAAAIDIDRPDDASDETPRLGSISSPLFSRHEERSPHTPRESMMPPDPSGLSISAQVEAPASLKRSGFGSSFGLGALFAPATPTAHRDSFGRFGKRQSSMAGRNLAEAEVDPSLTSRFDRVEAIGTGEFSEVFRVAKRAEPATSSQGYFAIPGGARTSSSSATTPMPDRVWAVKKSRNAYIGPKDRQRKLQEVEVLRSLGRADHTVHLVDSWENRDHLYIQTEFCEEGSLERFLERVGSKARLDDFRIWKILLELSLGLKHIHDSGFIHLDLKPANILVTFEGVLKIADFGMATSWPAAPGIEGEGDREYIGPEILMGQYDKPADVFALGLMMLEIAGNVCLPDNGASWQRLRNGDMSDVPSLTSSSDISLSRSPSAPTPRNRRGGEDPCGGFDSPDPKSARGRSTRSSLIRAGELATPPSFMVDASDEQALDKIVRWMISPLPADRPVAGQLLTTTGVEWAATRRRAGATIYEGNWGPADEVLQDDAEMIDV